MGMTSIVPQRFLPPSRAVRKTLINVVDPHIFWAAVDFGVTRLCVFSKVCMKLYLTFFSILFFSPDIKGDSLTWQQLGSCLLEVRQSVENKKKNINHANHFVIYIDAFVTILCNIYFCGLISRSRPERVERRRE